MPELSIIICVYNTAREYLDTCLRSITESTLAEGEGVAAADYEILMIDDGSTVDYSDLIEKYRVRCIKTENRGIFSARLLGIREALGDYIAFCDSDDTVSVSYHRPMLELAKSSLSDIVINDWAFHTERSRYYCISDKTVSEDIRLEGADCLAEFVAQEGRIHSFYVLWNKLFRASLLKRVAEKAAEAQCGDERFNYSEDALMCFFAFKWANRVQNLHTGYYFYRIHEAQSVTVASEDKLRRQIECMGVTFRMMMENIDDHPEAERIRKSINEWRALMSRTHYTYAVRGGYTSLYPKIKEIYGVASLRRSTARDGSGYAKNRLIGSNIEEIDGVLLSVYRGELSRTVSTAALDLYARRVLENMRDTLGRVELLPDGKTIIPREYVNLKSKILHNKIVYKLGMLLFPKGSRIRAFLKRRL